MFYLDDLEGVEIIYNPSQEELRKMARDIPTVKESAYGNLDRITMRKARMAKYTYIMAPAEDKDLYSGPVMEREKAQKYIEMQKDYIKKQGKVIVIDGYIGADDRAVPVRWIYTPDAANIAAMQQILAVRREEVEEGTTGEFQPLLTLVMTPGLLIDDLPGKMGVFVDLENFITYVMGSDYFGESKKGALRMLNDYVYKKGGLVFHAGAKAVQVGDNTYTVAILGLSGTGKTTTTFSKQGDVTRPIQDDMIVLWSDGRIGITENGCFAKTFGLKKENEPIIYDGTVHPDAWVENVYMNEDGTYDFSKTILTPEEVKRYRDIFVMTGNPEENIDAYIEGRVKAEDVVDKYGVPKDGWDFVVWTQNGRSVIPMSLIPDAYGLKDIPPLRFMGILNRDEGEDAATPGIVLFRNPYQAAAYFMLGETTKTSAAGKERGKVRSPFTNPFFPRRHALQAERFVELLSRFPDIITFMMNTGYVGGDASDEKEGRALKVKIRHSSAMLEALFRGGVRWIPDPDMGYYVVDVDAPENAHLLEVVPAEILQPRLWFEKMGKMDVYKEWVSRMRKERREYLLSMGVPQKIVEAL